MKREEKLFNGVLILDRISLITNVGIYSPACCYIKRALNPNYPPNDALIS
jgi:hypothetical protein